MKTTTIVGRTGALALTLAALFVAPFAALASLPDCPNCPDLVATISYDTLNGKLVLEVDEYPGFDAGDVDSVELVLTEGSTTEYVDVNFDVTDLDNPIWEQHYTPSGISGSGTTAQLRFWDSSTQDELFVDVTEE